MAKDPITVTINADSPDPDPVELGRGDQVNWYNNSGENLTVVLPPIFSPQGDPTIDNGQTSRDFTVNNNATIKSYEYSFKDPSAVPRNGTIDVT